MGFLLEDIIGSVGLTETVRKVSGGVPNPLPPAFMTGAVVKNVVCDQGRYFTLRDTRKTARQVQYGSAAVRRDQRDVGVQDVKLIHMFEEQLYDPNLLDRLSNPITQEVGMDMLKENIADFKRLFDNSEIMATISMLALGYIYYDSSGNFLPTSSGAALTVDPGIPAGNRTDVGGIIDAPWSTSSTNIPKHIAKIKKKYRQDTGKELQYAFYGVNVAPNMVKNDYVQLYLARFPAMNEKWLETGDIPQGLFGLKWIPVYMSFFADQNGTIQEMFDADAVTFCAEPDPTWWRFFKGSYRVPTSMVISRDAAEAMGAFRQEYGMFGYSLPSSNPPGITQFMGNTFLPTTVVEKGLILADTTP